MSKMDDKGLSKYKQAYDEIPIPSQEVDHSILTGFHKAKRERHQRSRKSWLLAVTAVAILLVGYISSLPIIDFIRDNKGLVDAVESDYYQELNVMSKEKDGVKFEIDGVIADDHGLALFYTIHSDVARDNMKIHDIQLQSEEEEVEYSTMTEGMTQTARNNKAVSGMIEYYFKESLPSTMFKVDVEITGSPYDGTIESAFEDTFEVFFELEKDLLTEKTYELNETVLIEDQKIVFKEVIIYPLRAAIRVEIDPLNTKKVLGFDDLRLVDETGETWGSIQNGVSGQKLEDDEIYYLQSNFFQDPKELYIEVNKIQAIDREISKVIINPETEEIIQQPKENYLKSVEIDWGYVVFKTDIDLMEHPINFSTITNEDKETITSTASYHRSHEFGFRMDNIDEHEGLIFLEISHYPLSINGDVKVQVK